MGPFEFQSRTRVVFGEGAIDRLGALATELGFHRTLLVADRGLVDAGHAERATGLLTWAGVEVVAFHDFGLNPTTTDVEAGRAFAAAHPRRTDSHGSRHRRRPHAGTPGRPPGVDSVLAQTDAVCQRV